MFNDHFNLCLRFILTQQYQCCVVHNRIDVWMLLWDKAVVMEIKREKYTEKSCKRIDPFYFCVHQFVGRMAQRKQNEWTYNLFKFIFTIFFFICVHELKRKSLIVCSSIAQTNKHTYKCIRMLKRVKRMCLLNEIFLKLTAMREKKKSTLENKPFFFYFVRAKTDFIANACFSFRLFVLFLSISVLYFCMTNKLRMVCMCATLDRLFTSLIFKWTYLSVAFCRCNGEWLL